MDIEVLKKVAKGLNELNCTWAIGGSVLLNQYNLVDNPNDIDILIDANESYKVRKFMDSIGTPINLQSKEPFKTKEFFGYMVDNTIIEFMGDFKIALGEDKIYKFILDKESIVNEAIIDEVKVNFTSLEDWFVAYKVMNDPKGRIPIIKQYFKDCGIKYKNLLKRNLSQDLPDYIKEEINEIL